MREGGARSVTLAALMLALGAGLVGAQVAMPDPKAMSGSVLEMPDVPAGTVTVRVIRGGFDKNIAGQAVEFLVDGKPRKAVTDAEGRAEVSGLARGTRVSARAVVDGERLESQEGVVQGSGLRIILVATDPEAEKRAAEDKALAAASAVKGMVVLGPETRVIAQMDEDRLHIYYILQIVNSARTPVDIGGPLLFDLPREARGATVIEGSSPQATTSGARLTITGPFAPGTTSVEVAYEMPYPGGRTRIEQRWPAALQQLTVMAQQIGGVSLSSPQFTSNQNINDQGRPLIIATGPGLAQGQTFTMDIQGLPHHPSWPRNLALTLAGVIVVAGLWGAFTAPPRRRVA
jgi:hypothetical protein